MKHFKIKRTALREWLAFFLVFMVFLGGVMPNDVVRADSRRLEATVTELEITDKDGNVPAEGYSTDSVFRLHYKWEVRNNGEALHAGNYVEVDLPKEFDFSKATTETQFNITNTDGEVVANVDVTPRSSGGGTARITFLDYANGKTEISENLYLKANWNVEEYPVLLEDEYEIDSTLFTGKIKIKPGEQLATEMHFLPGMMIPMRLAPGTPMEDGSITLYDDNHRIVDASNGDGTTVSPYNLATMTDTLFTINYKPFYYEAPGGGTIDYGDQRIVVDIPTYGFKLANPGSEGTQFTRITLLDKNGSTIPLDPATNRNYEKVVKIIYDIDDDFLATLGQGSNLVFNIAFNRRSLTDEECKKWLDDGKLETSLNVTACEGENNTPIVSTRSSSSYKWRMSPIQYNDNKTTVEGDRHLRASSIAKLANSAMWYYHDTDVSTSGPYTGNSDYYYFKQGTIHDGDTPLMRLKHIKIYAPKNAGVGWTFTIKELKGRQGFYDKDLANQFVVSAIQDDGDGKGKYFLLTP